MSKIYGDVSGMIFNFSIEDDKNIRRHVTKIEVMNMTKIGTHIEEKILFTCRRLDNGHPILAWEKDLNLPKNK